MSFLFFFQAMVIFEAFFPTCLECACLSVGVIPSNFAVPLNRAEIFSINALGPKNDGPDNKGEGTKYFLPWLSTWRLDLCEVFVWVSQFSCLPTWAKQWLVDFGRDIFPLHLFQCRKFQVWKIAYENPSLFTSPYPEIDFTNLPQNNIGRKIRWEDSCFLCTLLLLSTLTFHKRKKGEAKTKRKWFSGFSGWPSDFPREVISFWKPSNKTATYLSHEQKPLYLPLYCLFKNGMLIMVYENPHITG